MPPLLYAAGGLALACGFLLWRLTAAHRTLGKLKAENHELKQAILEARETGALSKERIRDLTGVDPDRVRIDEDGALWAE